MLKEFPPIYRVTLEGYACGVDVDWYAISATCVITIATMTAATATAIATHMVDMSIVCLARVAITCTGRTATIITIATIASHVEAAATNPAGACD